jgi:hypothetical protein
MMTVLNLDDKFRYCSCILLLILHGYSDSNMADDVNDRKSTSGMVFYLGPNPTSWNSRKKWWCSLAELLGGHPDPTCYILVFSENIAW